MRSEAALPASGLSLDRPAWPPAAEVTWNGWLALAIYLFSILGSVLLGVGAIAAVLVYDSVVGSPARALQHFVELGENGAFVIALSAPAPLIALVLAYLTVRAGARRRVGFLQAMRALPPYRWHHVVLVVIGAFVLAFALDLVAAALQRPAVPEVLRELTDTRPEWTVFTLWAGVGAALEEILYRGFLLPPAQRRFGAGGGILAVSLAFGLPHVLTYGLDVVLVGIASVMGLYLTLARHLTGSTVPGIAAHMLINLFAASQLYPA